MYKSIYVESSNEQLVQEYDLIQIGNEIKLNPNYIDIFSSETGLFASRMFGNVKYNIRIRKGVTSLGKFTEVGFSNFNSEFHNNLPSLQGEVKTTPNYYIENNITQMIDEMPLNDAQKKELRGKVKISCRTTWNFPTS